MASESDCEKVLKKSPEMLRIRQSDFSIDHILNRAGEQNCCKTTLEHITDQPIFDWIYYTRYRPPRLPRQPKQGPVKRSAGRLPRVPFTPSQLQSLEEAYSKSTYLSSDDAERIAQNLYLTSTRVKIWFQNRRARDRRERKDNNSPVDQQPINFSVTSSNYFLPTTSGSSSMNLTMERRSSSF